MTTLAGSGGKLWQRRRHGQRGAVQLSIRRGGGQRGQRLCGGLRQQHDSEGDAGGVVTTLGGPALAAGQSCGSCGRHGAARAFPQPYGVAVDSAGNVYVADSGNHRFGRAWRGGDEVVALEATQVIQDWSNSVPLIRGKETYVRAQSAIAAQHFETGYGCGRAAVWLRGKRCRSRLSDVFRSTILTARCRAHHPRRGCGHPGTVRPTA